MWSKLQDELLTHHKIDVGRTLLGADGGILTIGFFTICLLWTNRNLTDGFISIDTVNGFFRTFAKNPAHIADALVTAGFLEKVEGGYKVHDFHHHNPKAADVKQKREEDRVRKEQKRLKDAADKAANNGH